MISNSYSLSVKYYRNKFDNCNHLSIISNSLACRQGREKRKSWISNGTNFSKWSWTKSQFHEWIILINQQQAYESFHHERLMKAFFFFFALKRVDQTSPQSLPSECVWSHWWEACDEARLDEHFPPFSSFRCHPSPFPVLTGFIILSLIFNIPFFSSFLFP